jgi:hypothetical protein
MTGKGKEVVLRVVARLLTGVVGRLMLYETKTNTIKSFSPNNHLVKLHTFTLYISNVV